MDVTTATATAGASGTQRTASSAGTGPAITSDFETFLRMLTTQMQNQDPLNPIESSDYAVQLATFSGVEQQVKTNQLLESLAHGLGLTGLGQFAGWVGMEARVVAPVAFSGQPVTLAPVPQPGADRAELVVLDPTGAEVSRAPVAADATMLDWAGTDASGAPLPPGIYDFRLDSYTGDTLLGSAEVAAYARVVEVRAGTAGAVAVLAGGVEVPTADITALRGPAG